MLLLSMGRRERWRRRRGGVEPPLFFLSLSFSLPLQVDGVHIANCFFLIKKNNTTTEFE